MLVDIAILVVVIMMMFVVGLELTLDDFRMIQGYPKPVLVGTASQLIILPVDRSQLHHALTHYCAPGESCSALLVEDDKATREIMVRTLKEADWQVSEAGNGHEALDQLARELPQVILLDLMMPVMDGFDFLLEMRANTEWQDIPVIVLTAKDLTEEDRRILSGRVEQIVEKGASTHEHLVNLDRRVVDHAPA